jgi:hypothetical protein
MTRTELEIIEAFVQRVNNRAEANIEKTHKLEGSHYAAMTVELEILKSKYKDSIVEQARNGKD